MLENQLTSSVKGCKGISEQKDAHFLNRNAGGICFRGKERDKDLSGRRTTLSVFGSASKTAGRGFLVRSKSPHERKKEQLEQKQGENVKRKNTMNGII